MDIVGTTLTVALKMNRIKKIYMQKIVITFVIVTLSLTAMAQNRRVAVWEPDGSVNNSIKEIIREEISSVIVNTSGYIVVEREQMDRVFRENKFQASGLLDDSQISRMGRLMGANLVLVCNISQIGSNYYFSFKLIDVETARIEKQRTTQTHSGLSDLRLVVQITVGEMFGQTIVMRTLTADRKKVYHAGQKLSRKEVREAMTNTDALRLYNKGISRNRNGNIWLITGVCFSACSGYIFVAMPFEEQHSYNHNGNIYHNFDDKLNNAIGVSLAAAGTFMMISGIIMKTTAKGHIKQSVDMFNSRGGRANIDWKFDLIGNGIRLAIHF